MAPTARRGNPRVGGAGLRRCAGARPSRQRPSREGYGSRELDQSEAACREAGTAIDLRAPPRLDACAAADPGNAKARCRSDAVAPSALALFLAAHEPARHLGDATAATAAGAEPPPGEL